MTSKQSWARLRGNRQVGVQAQAEADPSNAPSFLELQTIRVDLAGQLSSTSQISMSAGTTGDLWGGAQESAFLTNSWRSCGADHPK